MKKSEYVKIVTHVPSKYLAQLQKVIGDAGAGREGDYRNCSFIMKGTGFFTPIEGAKPFQGKVGRTEIVEEYHLEFTCKKDILEDVVQVLKKEHPYEEVPIQIYEYFEI